MSKKDTMSRDLLQLVRDTLPSERAKLLKGQYAMFAAMKWDGAALKVIDLLNEYGLEGEITYEMRRRLASVATEYRKILQDCDGPWNTIYCQNSSCFAELYYTKRLNSSMYYLSCRFAKASMFYTYKVPVETLLGFLAAESRGKYYTSRIKGVCNLATTSYELVGGEYDDTI